MERDPDVFLMGEEVGVYNGAYKVSKGLLDRFGEMRVVDTPITELGFAGLGVGAAMTGLRPVIEFMTWNFALLAYDQIFNSAAKMLSMSGGQFKIPVTFRGPTGAALQLGAQHSQALESNYGALSRRQGGGARHPGRRQGAPQGAIRDDDPVCVFEGEMLYNLKGEVPEDDDFVIPLGVADLKREGSDVSIITHGKMIHVALQAAAQLEKDGVEADVLDLRTLRPLDTDAILGHRREDQPRGAAGGGVALRRHHRHRRGAHPGGGVRPPGRAGPAGHAGRRADAVRQAAGEGGQAQRRAGGGEGEPGAVPLDATYGVRSARGYGAGGGLHTHRRSPSTSYLVPRTSHFFEEELMATKVYMEALSPTMEEGRLVTWLKNEGDEVKRGRRARGGGDRQGDHGAGRPRRRGAAQAD
jgi:pyruvate dehydrogenase E1 component beta subunit